MKTTVVTANNYVKDNGIDHTGSLNFRKAINPGTEEDFKREMEIFYPNMNKHFKGLSKHE